MNAPQTRNGIDLAQMTQTLELLDRDRTLTRFRTITRPVPVTLERVRAMGSVAA